MLQTRKGMQVIGLASITLVLLVVILSSASRALAATNLVTNGDFETAGPTNWHQGGTGVNAKAFTYPVTGVGGSDAAQVSITSYTSGDAKWYFTPIVLASGIYVYSDSYKSDVPSIVTVQYHNANGTFTYHNLLLSAATSSFTQESVDFVVPPGTQDVTVFHLINSVGTLTVDDVSVSASTNTSGPFAHGAVTLTFDNGWLSQYDTAVPKMETDGYKGTFYIITHEIAPAFPGFVTDAQIQDLFNRGQEIGSHTQTHTDLLTLDAAHQLAEIHDSRQDLLTLNVGPINSFAYPFGNYNAAITQMVKDAGYTNARTTISGFVTPSEDRYLLPRKVILNSTTPAEIEGWIDEAVAEHSWLVIEFHQVDTSGDTYAITPDNFNQVIDYLHSNAVSVITMDQGVAALDDHPTSPPTPTAPVISDVAATNIGTSTVVIGWTTDTAATSRVFYGTTALYGLSTALDAAATIAHSMDLAGLTSATLYHFAVVSSNADGTATSSDATFTTLAETPTSPPPAVVAPTLTLSTTASGTTSLAQIPIVATFSMPVSGFSAGDISVSGGTVNSFVATSTSMYTFNVAPAAEGPITISVPAGAAFDVASTTNASLASNILSLTSGGLLPVIHLTGDAIVSMPIGGAYADLGATVTDPNDPAVVVIIDLSDVATSTEGTFTVRYNATDSFGHHAAEVTRTVVVTDLAISAETSASVTTNSVTINWTTAHPATSRVVWDTVSHDPLTATSTNYGYANSTTEDSATTTTHSVVISGLTAGTTYYFRPISHGSPEIPGTEISVTTTGAPTPAPSSGGGGGGGGNGPIVGSLGGGGGFSFTPLTTTFTPNTGLVLGASIFRFAKDLSRGMHDGDVMELQKRLVRDGFMTIDSPTNFFGPMTFASVKSYQAAHGIQQVGRVGPQTRASLNGSGMSDADRATLLASLQAQLQTVLAKIQALMAASGTH